MRSRALGNFLKKEERRSTLTAISLILSIYFTFLCSVANPWVFSNFFLVFSLFNHCVYKKLNFTMYWKFLTFFL
jgi:hypothetical protein